MSRKPPTPAKKKPAAPAKKAAKPKAPARPKKLTVAKVEAVEAPYDPSQPLPRTNDELLAQAYLANALNATQAYLTVHPKAKYTTARSEGPRALQNPAISARVKFLSDARAKEFEVDGKELLRHALAMATADHRHLSEFRYFACRYCHGLEHKYHRTLAEFESDRDKHEGEEDRREAQRMLAGKDYDRRDFDERGGPGFNAWALPHEECPNCFGHGEGRTILHDTSSLPPEAVILYAGTKEGKDGIEVKAHDKGKALDMLFRHKGLFEADNAQQAAATSPEALAAMAAAMESGRASQLQKLADRRGSGFTGD